MENSNLQTRAEYFKNKINSAGNLDEKIAITNQARKKCEFDFGNIVTRLKFEDQSKLEINTKFKAKILK
jgi:hypothetical protein